MKTKDIMRKTIVTVRSYLTVQELAKIFTEKCISGAPVLDKEGRIVGVVSQTDLVGARREQSPGLPLYHTEKEEPSSSVGMHYEAMDGTRVEEIMTPGAISFDQETLLSDLAREMTARHIHRVLITDQGRLVGIVTTMDMMRALLPAAKHKNTAHGHERKHSHAVR